MSDRTTGSSWAMLLRSALFSGHEPPPADFLARRSFYPWLVVGTTCIGAFIGQLDASIVQLALPTLEHEFAARLNAVSWVALAYQLTFAAVLPVFARLAEMVGRKLMYLAGFALFGVASILCGLATDLTELIAFRVLLGIAGAVLGANSVVILVKAAGPNGRGRAMGIFAAAQAVGISLGPIAGGMLLAELGWRWVFWVSVPFALFGAVVGWLVVPQSTDLSPNLRFDWQGAIFLMPGLASLLMLISECYAWGAASPAIIGSAIAATSLLWLFIRQERRTSAPLIDLGLFRAPAFAGGIVAIVLSYAMLYGVFFLMSFALVRGYHDSPMAAGLRLAIIPVALGIVAPFSGALHERLGPRAILLGGMAICAAALMLLFAVMTGAPASLPAVMVALAVYGVGLGIFIAPNNSLTLSSAPDRRSGEAGGLLNLMRVFGTGIGVASASAILAGIGGGTLNVSDPVLFGRVNDGLLLLIGFAAVAGTISVLRGPPPAPAVKAA